MIELHFTGPDSSLIVTDPEPENGAEGCIVQLRATEHDSETVVDLFEDEVRRLIEELERRLPCACEESLS